MQTSQRTLPAAKDGISPKYRLCEEPPFKNCGVDLFGPFVTKEGSKELKRYRALFSCFSSRVFHIETVAPLNIDSFILFLHRFIGRRGNIRLLRSDNGSNFVRASSEFKKAFAEMDQQRINDFMRNKGKAMNGCFGNEIHLQPAIWVEYGRANKKCKNYIDLFIENPWH